MRVRKQSSFESIPLKPLDTKGKQKSAPAQPADSSSTNPKPSSIGTELSQEIDKTFNSGSSINLEFDSTFRVGGNGAGLKDAPSNSPRVDSYQQKFTAEEIRRENVDLEKLLEAMKYRAEAKEYPKSHLLSKLVPKAVQKNVPALYPKRTELTDQAQQAYKEALNLPMKEAGKGFVKAGLLENAHYVVGQGISLGGFATGQFVPDKVEGVIGKHALNSVVSPLASGYGRMMTEVAQSILTTGGMPIQAPPIKNARPLAEIRRDMRRIEKKLDAAVRKYQGLLTTKGKENADGLAGTFEEMKALHAEGLALCEEHAARKAKGKEVLSGIRTGAVPVFLTNTGKLLAQREPLIGYTTAAVGVVGQIPAGVADYSNRMDKRIRHQVKYGNILKPEAKGLPKEDLTIGHLNVTTKDGKVGRLNEEAWNSHTHEVMAIVRPIYMQKLGELHTERLSLRKMSGVSEAERTRLQPRVGAVEKEWNDLLADVKNFELGKLDQIKDGLIRNTLDSRMKTLMQGFAARTGTPGISQSQILARFNPAFQAPLSTGQMTVLGDVAKFTDNLHGVKTMFPALEPIASGVNVAARATTSIDRRGRAIKNLGVEGYLLNERLSEVDHFLSHQTTWKPGDKAPKDTVVPEELRDIPPGKAGDKAIAAIRKDAIARRTKLDQLREEGWVFDQMLSDGTSMRINLANTKAADDALHTWGEKLERTSKGLLGGLVTIVSQPVGLVRSNLARTGLQASLGRAEALLAVPPAVPDTHNNPSSSASAGTSASQEKFTAFPEEFA